MRNESAEACWVVCWYAHTCNSRWGQLFSLLKAFRYRILRHRLITLPWFLINLVGYFLLRKHAWSCLLFLFSLFIFTFTLLSAIWRTLLHDWGLIPLSAESLYRVKRRVHFLAEGYSNIFSFKVLSQRIERRQNRTKLAHSNTWHLETNPKWNTVIKKANKMILVQSNVY